MLARWTPIFVVMVFIGFGGGPKISKSEDARRVEEGVAPRGENGGEQEP